MKTALILFACLLAGCAVNVGEHLSLPGKMEIGRAPEGQKALYESQLSKAVGAVNTWWAEHGAGFRGYPMRMPRAAWVALGPSFSNDPDVIGLSEERAGKGEPIWYASTSKAHPGSWKLSFASGGEYALEWKVDVLVTTAPKLVEVRMIYPAIGWTEAE